MSWQAYVDQSLLLTGKIDAAAIFSAAGDSVWAASPGITIDHSEITALIAAFNNRSDINPLFANGFTIGKVKYFTIKADDRSVYGKQGKEGVCCVKTKQAILVGHYPETVQPGEAATVVEKLADYLIGVGY